jgi:hypothetical protein
MVLGSAFRVQGSGHWLLVTGLWFLSTKVWLLLQQDTRYWILDAR